MVAQQCALHSTTCSGSKFLDDSASSRWSSLNHGWMIYGWF